MKLQKNPTPKPIKNTQTVKDILFIVLINDKFDKQFPHVESQITVRIAAVTKQATCLHWVLPRGFGCSLWKAALVLPCLPADFQCDLGQVTPLCLR